MPRFAVAILAAVAVAACSPTAPSRALDNTSWVLESVGGTAVTLGARPTLTFRTGGTFTGFAGCNDLFGESEIREGTIKIEQLASTARGCRDPAAEPVEVAYVDALQRATGWSVDGDTLTVTGAAELVFSRSQAPPATPPRPSP